MELNVAMSHLQLGVLNLRSALQKCSVTSEVEEAALAILSEIRELTGFLLLDVFCLLCFKAVLIGKGSIFYLF